VFSSPEVSKNDSQFGSGFFDLVGDVFLNFDPAIFSFENSLLKLGYSPLIFLLTFSWLLPDLLDFIDSGFLKAGLSIFSLEKLESNFGYSGVIFGGIFSSSS